MKISQITLMSLLLTVAQGIMAEVAQAAVIFNADPFAGSDALTTPGRQVVGINEGFLPFFDINSDSFIFDDKVPAFAVVSPISFFNGVASAIPAGANTIVLQDTDNDNNPATPFNAGTAANLIEAALPDKPTPGFFVYWNSGLRVNRLVYSTDLSDNSAGLSILARILSPTDGDAIAELPRFSAQNFDLVDVPEPTVSSWLLGGVALATISRLKRR